MNNECCGAAVLLLERCPSVLKADGYFFESSEKLPFALLITQIIKNDYRDFWTS
jgi:hypothetical protein